MKKAAKITAWILFILVSAILLIAIDTLQGQLEVKDRQIENLTEALVAAQQTAAAAQAHHAGTIQQQLLTGEAGADQQDLSLIHI